MFKTGIVRKIDDLGRIVLPKELRKSLNINTGDDFQISLDNDKIILEKYSFLQSYESKILDIIECFVKSFNYVILFTINDKIVNMNNIVFNSDLYKIILDRKVYIDDRVVDRIVSNDVLYKGRLVVLPIVINSDLLGSIIIISDDDVNRILMVINTINNIIKNFFVV